MFEDALKYPSRGDDATRTILIGGGLQILAMVVYFLALVLSVFVVGFLLLPLVLVPQVLIYGYLVRVARDRLAGREEPPVWDEWTDLFVDGLKVFLITLVYSLPLVVVWVFGTILAVFAGMAGTDVGSALGSGVIAVLTLVSVVYSLAMLYVLPAGLVNFAREDSVRAAFDLDAVRAASFDSDYAVAWLLAAVVWLVGSLVGQVLVLLLFVGFFVLFYVMVSTTYLLTEGYADALGVERPEEGAPAEGQATLADVEEAAAADGREERGDVAGKGAEVYPAVEDDEHAEDAGDVEGRDADESGGETPPDEQLSASDDTGDTLGRDPIDHETDVPSDDESEEEEADEDEDATDDDRTGSDASGR